MASFRFTKLKITAGYTLLLAILLFSLVFVHREMEALSAADDQQNLRTDSLLTLLHEKDQNTIQMLRVLSEANDSLLSASEIEEIISVIHVGCIEKVKLYCKTVFIVVILEHLHKGIVKD